MCENEASGQQAVELKPCPFCGGMAQHTDVPTDDESDPNAGGSFIECRECAASTALHFDRKENLEDSWNSRAAPTAPSTAAGEREYLARQYLAIARDHAGHIVVEQHGPNGEEPCTVADLIDAALATPPAQEGGGGDEYQSAITQDQVDRARNAFFKKMMLGFGVDDCFFAALHATQEGTGNG